MAHNSSDMVLLSVGVVVLAMCICFDVYTSYKRGAKWIPGRAVVIYALCLQLIGYLDVQNVSIQSKDRDQQLEVLVSSQLSVDSSRLVLLVFVGHLLSNLASSSGFWTNIAALFTSLSTHITIELFVAFQSRVIEKDRVVKGETGIWVIVSDMVLLESILLFSFLLCTAISRGRFIRDNLGSRIPLALESPKNNNETISWDTCKSEMLKSWIVARVCQPEYVLTRSAFSLLVLCLVTFNVLFMGVKVIFLRSQLHGPSSLFTMQCIFIILGWLVLLNRFFINLMIFQPVRHRDSPGSDISSTARFISTTIALTNKIENLCCRLVALLVVGILFIMVTIVVYALVLTVGIMMLFVPFLLVSTLMVCPGSCVTVLIEKFSSAPPLDEDADFCRCREALEGVCMPGDNANRLWAPNRSSFNHMKKCIEQAYEKGKEGENLKKVIAERLAQNISPSEDVKELLEPLESVRRYFPLLKDSFQKITASILLMDDSVSEDHHSMREFKGDVRAALKEAEELMDFLDCPDNIGASVDVFNISNLEAFMLKNASDEQFKRLRFNFRESSSVADAVEKMFNEAQNKLSMCNLLGDVNPQAVDTDWSKAAEPYAMYKVCKLILDRHLTNSVQQMEYHLINMAIDLIAICVRESPRILVECSRKWAAEFREDNISAAIKLEGFACGVIDGAREQQHHQQPV